MRCCGTHFQVRKHSLEEAVELASHHATSSSSTELWLQVSLTGTPSSAPKGRLQGWSLSVPFLPLFFVSATSQRIQDAPEVASLFLLDLFKNLKEGNWRLMRMSEPLTSDSGALPQAYPLPVGTLGLSNHLLSLSSKALVTLWDGIWTEIGFTSYFLPFTLGGQVHFWHSPAEITHNDVSFASKYSWPHFDPISFKTEHEIKPLVPLFNQKSEFSSCGLNDFMFIELHQW